MTEITPKTMRFRVTDQNGQDITDQVTITAVEVPTVFRAPATQCPACLQMFVAPGRVLPEHSRSGIRCPGSGVQIEGAAP